MIKQATVANVMTSFRCCIDKWKAAGILNASSGSQFNRLYRIAKRHGNAENYGKRYFYLMRLLDALLESEGLRLSAIAPHKAAAKLIDDWLVFLPVSQKTIATSRHKFKYEKEVPNKAILASLEERIGILERVLEDLRCIERKRKY